MITPLLTALLVAASQPTASPLQIALEACADEPDDRRLACYDFVLGRSAEQAEKRAPMAPEEVRAQAAAAARGEPLRAGGTAASEASDNSAPIAEARRPANDAPAPGPVGQRPSETLPVDVALSALDFNPYGRARITLSNGQVWQQLNSDSIKLRKRKKVPVSDMTASVKTAALGSFRMKVLPSKQTLRVRRVK